MVQVQTYIYRDLMHDKDAATVQWEKNGCLKIMLD